MTLHIRQIVLAARDLRATVAQLQSVLGVNVCYHDPEVGKFGLENALFTIGHERGVQFLEVVSPVKDNTAAGRHLDRHGDSGYMLILQTDDLARDRARINKLGVRIVWEAKHADVSAMHLHPKDIGAAIVSLDQPIPPESWRWAGPDWQRHVTKTGAQRVISTTVASQDPIAMAQRWATVLGTAVPVDSSGTRRIDIKEGVLNFVAAKSDVIAGFGIKMSDPQAALTEARKQDLPVFRNTVTICGTQFELSA
jgi:Glyoxalase-like domain